MAARTRHVHFSSNAVHFPALYSVYEVECVVRYVKRYDYRWWEQSVPAGLRTGTVRGVIKTRDIHSITVGQKCPKISLGVN